MAKNKGLDSFSLKGCDKGFNNKKKGIFEQIETLETKYNSNLIDRFSTDDKEQSCDVDTKNPEMFRTPSERPSRRRDQTCREKLESSMRKGCEDYNEKPYTSRKDYNNRKYSTTFNNKRKSRHDFSDPAKWTKYSLEDVEIDSESKNTSTALEFLAEQRNRNSDSVVEEGVNLNDKITFSKPSGKEVVDLETKPTKMYGSVYRMPECVVGAKKKNISQRSHQDGSKISAGGSVQLEFDFEDGQESNKDNSEEMKTNMFKKIKQKKFIRKRQDIDDI
ncbi:uncharacterized protein [Antedon mediterranea]|uniref:uncharacterized protein n=1 Tax=Antedon mediterranea TaxID=105859 RepID=UPI003AF562F1